MVKRPTTNKIGKLPAAIANPKPRNEDEGTGPGEGSNQLPSQGGGAERAQCPHNFHYVRDWSSIPAGKAQSVSLFSSLISSNTNIINTPRGNFLIDTGNNQSSVSKDVLASFATNSKFIGLNTVKWNKGNMSSIAAENEFLANNPNMFPKCRTTVKNVLKAYVENMLSSLQTDKKGNIRFKCMIITSRDEDNWSFLKHILYSDIAEHTRRENVKVDCFVFHGTPEFFDEKKDGTTQPSAFLLLIQQLQRSFPPRETEIYHASYTQPLPPNFSGDVESFTIQPPLYYVRKEKGVHTYCDSGRKIAFVPFRNHLTISRGTEEVAIVLPILNPHHKMDAGMWFVPAERGNYNEDVLMVGVMINDVSILLTGDASTTIQQRYINVAKSFLTHCVWNIILSCHNSSMTRASFLKSLFIEFLPSAVILPMCYLYGYSPEALIEFVSQLGLAKVERHKIYYFVKDVKGTEPDEQPDEEQNDEEQNDEEANAERPDNRKPVRKRKYLEKVISSEKCMFSLTTPLTVRFCENDIYFAQDVGSLVPKRRRQN